MGLALDEPREGDESYTVDDIPVIMDPFALKIVRESGGASIRSSIFGPMVELNSATAGACSCQ
jgi:hypothetical protein